MENKQKELRLLVDTWQLEILRLALCYFKQTPEYIDDSVKKDVTELEDSLY